MRKTWMRFLGSLCKNAFAESIIAPEEALKALGIDPAILSAVIPQGEITQLQGAAKQPPVTVPQNVAVTTSTNGTAAVTETSPQTAVDILQKAASAETKEASEEIDGSEEEKEVEDGGDETKVDLSKIPGDVLNAVSKREKDKLYGKIRRVEEKNSTLATENETLTQRIAELEKQVKQPESEAYKGLLERFSALAVTAANQKKQIESFSEVDEDEIRKEYEDLFKLREYRLEKILNAQGRVIPELVTGDTKEEIDASFDKAVARFDEIAKVGGGGEKSSQAQPKSGVGARSVRPSAGAAPKVTQDTQLTPESVRNMSFEQVGELMKQLGVGGDTF